ncbi:MAG: chemotaxis protein CheX [Deltaproteobacteria bacterium]|nr:chemotaxis protein CheX [Deltaproteobacteria bacterium]
MNERAKEILTTVSIETLKHLAFIFLSPEEENNGLMSDSMAVGISFSGPFSGSLVLKMSPVIVLEQTSNMLGIDEDRVTTEQQYDAMKETINVICGNLLPAISGNQVIFHIDVPEIVGKENNIEEKAEALAKLSVDDEQCECYLFVDGDLPL